MKLWKYYERKGKVCCHISQKGNGNLRLKFDKTFLGTRENPRKEDKFGFALA